VQVRSEEQRHLQTQNIIKLATSDLLTSRGKSGDSGKME